MNEDIDALNTTPEEFTVTRKKFGAESWSDFWRRQASLCTMEMTHTKATCLAIAKEWEKKEKKS